MTAYCRGGQQHSKKGHSRNMLMHCADSTTTQGCIPHCHQASQDPSAACGTRAGAAQNNSPAPGRSNTSARRPWPGRLFWQPPKGVPPPSRQPLQGCTRSRWRTWECNAPRALAEGSTTPAQGCRSGTKRNRTKAGMPFRKHMAWVTKTMITCKQQKPPGS